MKIVKQRLGVKHKHQHEQVQSQRDIVIPRGCVNLVAEGRIGEGVEVKVEEKEVKTEPTAVKGEEEEGEPSTDGEPEPGGETQRKHKKALLIGIQNYDDVKRLRGPHQDVLDMPQLLIGGPSFSTLASSNSTDVGVDHYGYNPDDICALVDRDDLEEDMKPTMDNIVRLHFISFFLC